MEIEDSLVEVQNIASFLGGFPKYAHGMGLELARSVLAEDWPELNIETARTGLFNFISRYCKVVEHKYNKAVYENYNINPEYEYIIKK